MTYQYDEESTPEENIAIALYGIAMELRNLGNGSASTTFGAIEGLSMSIQAGIERAGDSIAGAIAEAASH